MELFLTFIEYFIQHVIIIINRDVLIYYGMVKDNLNKNKNNVFYIFFST